MKENYTQIGVKGALQNKKKLDKMEEDKVISGAFFTKASVATQSRAQASEAAARAATSQK